MSTTITIGADVRHWITYEVKDATPEEIAILERGWWNEDSEAIPLLREMRDAGRLERFGEDSDSYADHFSAESNSAITAVEHEEES